MSEPINTDENAPEQPHAPKVRLRRPRLWTLVVALLLASVAQLVFGFGTLVVLAIVREGVATPQELASALQGTMLAPEAVLLAAGVQMAIFAAIALVAARLSPQPIVRRLRLGRPQTTPQVMVVALVGTFGIQMAFVAASALGWVPESAVLERVGEIVSGIRGTTVFFAILAIGVAPGIGEELLFRGYVQTRLSERFGPVLAVILTAVAFGSMHLDLSQGIFALAMAAYLGMLTEKVGSILPAIICHAMNNSLATIAGAGGFNMVPRERGMLVLCLSLVVVGYAAYRILTSPRAASLKGVQAEPASPEPPGMSS